MRWRLVGEGLSSVGVVGALCGCGVGWGSVVVVALCWAWKRWWEMAIGVSVQLCFIRTWVEAVSGTWGE